MLSLTEAAFSSAENFTTDQLTAVLSALRRVAVHAGLPDLPALGSARLGETTPAVHPTQDDGHQRRGHPG